LSLALVVLNRLRQVLARSLAKRRRLVEEHNRTQRAFGKLDQCTLTRIARRPEERGILPGSGVFLVRRRLGRSDGPLRQREQRRAHDRCDRPLRARIEFAHRFNRIAQQLDAHGTRRLWGKCIDDAAADSKLSRQLDHFGARIAD
jgi:hypothetical protein